MKGKILTIVVLELILLACVAGSVALTLFLTQENAVPADSTIPKKIIIFSVPFLLLLLGMILVIAGRVFWKKSRRLVQVEAVCVILLVSIEAAVLLISTRQPPVRQEREIPPPLVQVEKVVKKDVQMIVEGFGTVRPKIQVEIVPEVSGKVVAIHPQLVGGGFFQADETLIKIDPDDYELAVQRAEAAVARAQVTLDKEQAEADVARQEWQQLRPGEEPDSPLVFRGPQIREAQAALTAAQAELATAQLNLERTEISVPIDGRVVNERVDLGQFISMGQSVATVYGTEVVEIPVPLEDRELAWFKVPGNPNGYKKDAANSPGSEVEISADFAGGRRSWKGYVVRSEGQIDPQSRMAYIIVEVHDPFEPPVGGAPLVPGMFVEVAIKGRSLDDTCLVSRSAIHNGNEVWLIRDGRLHIQPVEISRRDREFAYVTSGLQAGDTVIVTPLDVVSDGMRIRTVQTDNKGL